MKALDNKVIINTRPENISDKLLDLLTNEGASVLSLPMIETRPVEITDELKSCYNRLSDFNWLIFTSRNGVIFFFHFLKTFSDNYNLPSNLKVAAIGLNTANELKRFNCSADFIGKRNSAKDLLDDLLVGNIYLGDKVLLALGNLASDMLQKELGQTAEVSRINTYETIQPVNVNNEFINLIRKDDYDLIIFASPSAFSNFITISDSEFKNPLKIASIGKTTTKQIVNLGYSPIITATKSSSEGLVEAIISHYKNINTIQK